MKNVLEDFINLKYEINRALTEKVHFPACVSCQPHMGSHPSIPYLPFIFLPSFPSTHFRDLCASITNGHVLNMDNNRNPMKE
jgi:hypothetical protein